MPRFIISLCVLQFSFALFYLSLPSGRLHIFPCPKTKREGKNCWRSATSHSFFGLWEERNDWYGTQEVQGCCQSLVSSRNQPDPQATWVNGGQKGNRLSCVFPLTFNVGFRVTAASPLLGVSWLCGIVRSVCTVWGDMSQARIEHETHPHVVSVAFYVAKRTPG